MAGRAIVVGDPNQAIYGFRGADSKAFPNIHAMLQRSIRPVTTCELPVNYRCDQAIIENAQRWVPDLQGSKNARGTVDTLTFFETIERANNDGTDISLPDGENNAERSLPLAGKEHTSFAYLCRINVPIIVTAYQLIGQKKRVCIIGRAQIGQPLIQLIEDLCGTNERQPNYTNRISNRLDDRQVILEEGLMTRLANYMRVQTQKLAEEKYEKKLEALTQNVECIEVIAEQVHDDKVSSIIDEINKLFAEEPAPGVISLSTCHRCKGLEWDVVFILRPDLMPHPSAKSAEELEQEKNICYVGATRAKHRLYYVSNWPFGKGKNKPLNWDGLQPTVVPNAVTNVSPSKYVGDDEVRERRAEGEAFYEKRIQDMGFVELPEPDDGEPF